MKVIRLITIAISLFFISCSSTYTLKDFSSKEKFYEDFNKSMNNKLMKVLLRNDSSFIITDNVKISNDSLVILNPQPNAMNSLALENVREISSIYKGNNRFTGLWIGSSFSFLLSIAIIWAVDDMRNDFHTLPQFPASFGFAAAGGIIGYLIGSIYDRPITYLFNP